MRVATKRRHPRIRLMLTERKAAALLNILDWVKSGSSLGTDAEAIRRELELSLKVYRMVKNNSVNDPFCLTTDDEYWGAKR